MIIGHSPHHLDLKLDGSMRIEDDVPQPVLRRPPPPHPTQAFSCGFKVGEYEGQPGKIAIPNLTSLLVLRDHDERIRRREKFANYVDQGRAGEGTCSRIRNFTAHCSVDQGFGTREASRWPVFVVNSKISCFLFRFQYSALNHRCSL